MNLRDGSMAKSQSTTADEVFLVVGTFTHSTLHVLSFVPSRGAAAELKVVATLSASGKHSWLALDRPRDRLYATSWTDNDDNPAVVAYQLHRPGSSSRNWQVAPFGQQIDDSRSGYVALAPVEDESVQCPSALYSVGGPSGEVFLLDQSTGGFQDSVSDIKGSAARLQELDFLAGGRVSLPGKTLPPLKPVATQDASKQHTGVQAFGGLRHGSHSIDVGPVIPGTDSLRPVYVADIGRNCVFIYTTGTVESLEDGQSCTNGALYLAGVTTAPRDNDGPRHVWPHPNGKTVYVLQEHACVIDVYTLISESGTTSIASFSASCTAVSPLRLSLKHEQSLRLIPPSERPSLYWADEVRLSPSGSVNEAPAFLFGSTRGLEPETKGWLALYELDDQGFCPSAGRVNDADGDVPLETLRQRESHIDLIRTPTSGGWANAIEPSPILLNGQIFAALTDSEDGLVMMYSVEGGKLKEVARTELGMDEQGKIRGAATAVWLSSC